MRLIVFLATVLTLAACGADGPPQTPQSGVVVGGEARMGVTGKL